jgi:hypothetical protein
MGPDALNFVALKTLDTRVKHGFRLKDKGHYKAFVTFRWNGAAPMNCVVPFAWEGGSNTPAPDGEITVSE